MSIADYTDLAVQVSEHTGRDDFMQMFPRFVSFVENTLNRELRVGGMENITTLTTATDGSVALPLNFLEMREVKDSAGRVMEASAVTGADWQHGPYSGTPLTYYIINETLYVVPIAAATFTVRFFKKIIALTAASNTTNWLLTDAPKLYLYGVCAEVAGWAAATGKGDIAQAQAMAALFRTEIDQYAAQDMRKRFSNTRITPRGVNP